MGTPGILPGRVARDFDLSQKGGLPPGAEHLMVRAVDARTLHAAASGTPSLRYDPFDHMRPNRSRYFSDD